MVINNLYTTDIVTTGPIPTQFGGILDNSFAFPPAGQYRMVFTPKPGEAIQAAQFKRVTSIGVVGGFELSLLGTTNSHTQWPSRFQLAAPGLGDVDTTTASGYKEFPGFYKVVFEDSTNPTNDTNWDFGVVGNTNKVYMWIYFGKNETTGMDSLSNVTIDLDIDYHPDPFTLIETTVATAVGGSTFNPVINNFNI